MNEHPTPQEAVPTLLEKGLTDTTALIDVRELRKSFQDGEPAVFDSAALLARIALEVEQNRFSFISGRDTDQAVHAIFDRLEELSTVLQHLAFRTTRLPS